MKSYVVKVGVTCLSKEKSELRHAIRRYYIGEDSFVEISQKIEDLSIFFHVSAKIYKKKSEKMMF